MQKEYDQRMQKQIAQLEQLSEQAKASNTQNIQLQKKLDESRLNEDEAIIELEKLEK